MWCDNNFCIVRTEETLVLCYCFVLDHVTPHGAQIEVPRAEIAQEGRLHLLAIGQQLTRGQNSTQVPYPETRRLYKVRTDI